MSSATSTKDQRPTTHDDGLQPWQFFVLGSLGCATAVTFMVRGRDLTTIVLLSVMMATTALVGMAALRALRPLVSTEEDRTVMIGARTRVALEREKLLVLRSIKELEFDRAMGKLSEDDFLEMSSRLRVRAAGLMRQLDAGAGYRDQIERDLAKRLGDAALKGPRHGDTGKAPRHGDTGEGPRRGDAAADTRGAALSGPPAEDTRTCAACSTANDPDARFCKNCGGRL